jgi:3-oxoacyl-[acyl-carrier protein] reductase
MSRNIQPEEVRPQASLRGKAVVVTGGGRGIGRATAQVLARAGANVMVTARTADEIADTVAEIGRQGGRAVSFAADVSNWLAMRQLAEETARVLSPAEIVVINASVVHPVADTWTVEPADWARNVEINLTGAFYTARAFLPGMVGQGQGTLIFVSSGAAVHTVPGWSAYAAAKAGMEQFAHNLASELDQRDVPVRVHVLHPGIVATSMQERVRQVSAEQFPLVEQYRKYHEKGYLRPPEQPARLIWWLATPMAADLRGQVVSIDDPAIRSRVATDLGGASLPSRGERAGASAGG